MTISLVGEYVLRARLAVIEVATYSPHMHVFALLRSHLFVLNVANASIGVHYTNAHALNITKALQRRLACVAGGGY
ncbi:hypothetical protein SDC9_204835 [bioreactor metagenome]|uniref:Uncharacterized protein n=1 Tax=bioreactor metagenome TaxID=1076179 RepID=A0A645J0N0_9ZZZZ